LTLGATLGSSEALIRGLSRLGRKFGLAAELLAVC
jgi:hypothetical protein